MCAAKVVQLVASCVGMPAGTIGADQLQARFHHFTGLSPADGFPGGMVHTTNRHPAQHSHFYDCYDAPVCILS